MAVQGVIAALLLTGAAERWMLAALVAVYGCFEAFFRPAAGGLVPEVAGPEHLQQANALLGLAQNVGTVLGPTLGGVLVVTVPAYAFLWSSHDEALGHRRRYTRRRLADLLEGAGFRLEVCSYAMSAALPPAAIVRLDPLIELAKHAEHRLRDYAQARAWTERALAIAQSHRELASWIGGIGSREAKQRELIDALTKRLHRIQSVERKRATTAATSGPA